MKACLAHLASKRLLRHSPADWHLVPASLVAGYGRSKGVASHGCAMAVFPEPGVSPADALCSNTASCSLPPCTEAMQVEATAL
jgi:hypothetical protein